MTDLLEQQKDLAPEHIKSTWSLLLDAVKRLPPYKDIRQVIICGCGDSHHASLGLGMGISDLAGLRCLPANSMTAARYLIPASRRSASELLVIGISASGEVARTIEAVEVGNRIGAQTLAFTGNGSGSLAEAADEALVFSGPELPHGPGLISYLTSLLMGYAFIHHLLVPSDKTVLEDTVGQLISKLEPWINDRWDEGTAFGDEPGVGTCVFLGSGPALGSAMFAAAKLIESAGEFAWGQDVEEWAHLEYFCAPSQMRTWLLSAGGRCRTRELEVREAARAIGRSWHEDQWDLLSDQALDLTEIVAPLTLWAGPSGYAARRTEIMAETPFRNFSGGRDRREGGGPSRIRSSVRVDDFSDGSIGR